MKIHKLIIVLTVVFIGLSSQPAQAMSSESEAEFKIIMDMSLDQLGQISSEVLDERHPDTDWASYNFPDYIYDGKATEIAYKVAVKNPGLLGTVNVSDEEIVIPCYCTCDSFGHNNLLYCF